jgi:hypothetical protein
MGALKEHNNLRVARTDWTRGFTTYLFKSVCLTLKPVNIHKIYDMDVKTPNIIPGDVVKRKGK